MSKKRAFWLAVASLLSIPAGFFLAQSAHQAMSAAPPITDAEIMEALRAIPHVRTADDPSDVPQAVFPAIGLPPGAYDDAMVPPRAPTPSAAIYSPTCGQGTKGCLKPGEHQLSYGTVTIRRR